jgi:hypothetical protein
MADPIDEILAGAPKRQTRKQEWGSKGIPKNPQQAHQRIRAARATRKKVRGNAALSGTFPGPIVKAVEAISTRFGVSRSAVMKRMLEDGIKRYGNVAELELAQLAGPNPFEEFQPPTTWVPDIPIVREILESEYVPREPLTHRVMAQEVIPHHGLPSFVKPPVDHAVVNEAEADD